MDFDSARDDVLVAAVAAASLIALTLANRYLLDADPGTLVELSPLYVYLGYLFSRKGGPYTAVDTLRNWVLLTVLVTIGTFAYVAV